MPETDAGSPETHSPPVRPRPTPYRDDAADAFLDDSEGGDRPIGVGLPPAFRMRHARHYVEHLIGDSPLQTVRQVAPEDIAGGRPVPPDGLADLAASIRDVGLLQPLLVTRAGATYELIAGDRRLAAARQMGLASVPCLVLDIEPGGASRLRAEAGRKAARPVPVPSEPAETPAELTGPGALAIAIAEAASMLTFVNRLAPVVQSTDRPWRAEVLNGLVETEVQWAGAVAAAASFLLRTQPAPFEPLDVRALAEGAHARVAFEARARAVSLALSCDLELAAPYGDQEAVTTAWHGLLHAAVRLPGARAVETVVKAPRIRPAVILEVSVIGVRLPESALEGLFHAGNRQHPAGAGGAVLLAAAAASARRHGGRISAAAGDGGLGLSYVAPHPLDHLA